MNKLSFRQQIIAGFIITLLFVFGLAVMSYFSIVKRIRDLQAATTEINYTRNKIDKINEILVYLLDAETGERGYILTGDETYLQPYNLATQNLENALVELKSQLREPITDTLNYYVALRMAELNKVIQVYNSSGLAAANTAVMTNKGQNYMNKVRETANRIRKDQKSKQDTLSASFNMGSDRTLIIILSGSFILLCLVTLLLSYIIRTFQQQKLIEENVRNTNIQLELVSDQNKTQNWLLKGSAALDNAMRGEQAVEELAHNIISELSGYTGAQIGAMYLVTENAKVLSLSGNYAFDSNAVKRSSFKMGEGLVGQAALGKKKIILAQPPENYVRITSSLGDAPPKLLLVQPFMIGNTLKGVLELGFANDPGETTLQFVDMVVDSIAIAIDTSQARLKMQMLFEKTQQQSEELESQQEELRTTNEELIRKTEALQASEEELHVQQEELKQINAELQEKAVLLQQQNETVDQARQAMSVKAEELEMISKYKSEFLANMSHELRTPLNSILILARILKDNKNLNLTDEQVKYSTVIHNAGTDLLTLINDILDLSKIESGKIELTIEQVDIHDVQLDLELLFRELATNKRIQYSAHVDPAVPRYMVSDRLRLEQILKNLLSNAFKFTPEKGSVSVDVRLADAHHHFYNPKLNQPGTQVVAFSVSDTGIGIPEEKQKAIFEAFQQADGSTSRKYGGTGLGLSISRELANILGGQIEVTSTAGEGSTFTIFLPVEYAGDLPQPATTPVLPAVLPLPRATALADLRTLPSPAPRDDESQVLLIIEDDPNFADVLKDYALERGFIPLLAFQGDTGLEMAISRQPDAIVLDIMLPVMDGWTVLRKLKELPETKHIPVHMMSAGDEPPLDAKSKGAIGFLKKPVEHEKLEEAFDLLLSRHSIELNKVLIIEDHEVQSEHLREQLIKNGIEVTQAFNGEQALELLGEGTGFDCIILDLNLPDMLGLDLLDKIKTEPTFAGIPVVINTAMELSQHDVSRVMKHTHAMVLKSNKSNDRLLDEVNLFMNRIKSDDEKVPGTRAAFSGRPGNDHSTMEKALKNRTVLIVDDDMRNVFAITSALQAYELKIDIANDGREALKKLDEKPDTDIVLMDIMMPEMDGYEAMREIRKQKRFAKLPILALTAKAMKADRDKCMEAGANDYISKPVDIDKLLSLMRVWIS